MRCSHATDCHIATTLQSLESHNCRMRLLQPAEMLSEDEPSRAKKYEIYPKGERGGGGERCVCVCGLLQRNLHAYNALVQQQTLGPITMLEQTIPITLQQDSMHKTQLKNVDGDGCRRFQVHTLSTLPDTATMQPTSFASCLACERASSTSAEESTPRVCTAVPATAMISEALPRIMVGCSFTRSVITCITKIPRS